MNISILFHFKSNSTPASQKKPVYDRDWDTQSIDSTVSFFSFDRYIHKYIYYIILILSTIKNVK